MTIVSILGTLFTLGGIVCLSVARGEALRLRKFERGSEPVTAKITAFGPQVRACSNLTPVLTWRDPHGMEHSAAAPIFSFLFLIKKRPVHLGMHLDALWNPAWPEEIKPVGKFQRWLPVIGVLFVGLGLFTAAAATLLNTRLI